MLYCAAILASPCQSAFGADVVPFATANMNPFMVMYGSPRPQSAQIEGQGQLRSDVTFTLANNSITAETPAESIVLDGESYLLSLGMSYGYAQRWAFGVSVPFVYHSEGFLDNFIEDWHKVFGLDNGRRASFSPNKLNYSYSAGGESEYAVTDNQGGLGDVVFGAKYAVIGGEESDRHVALALEVKAPTGDPDKLTGSGATDVALSLHANDRRLLSGISTALFGGAGIAFLGDGDVLAQAQEDMGYSAYFGGAWRPLAALALTLQLNFQSAIYASDLKQLGTDALALHVGGSYFASKGTRFDFAIGENLYTDPTPDFLLYLGVAFNRDVGR